MGLLSAILFTSNCGSLSHDEADRVLKGRDIGEDADGHREVFDGVLGLGIRRLGLGKICVFKNNFKVERGSIRKDKGGVHLDAVHVQ